MEYAPILHRAASGRSECFACKQKIKLGSPRFVSLSGHMHGECALEHFRGVVEKIKGELDKMYGIKE